jgi:hypothetical protein
LAPWVGFAVAKAASSSVALLTWRDLLLRAKHLFVAAIGPCTPMGRATGPPRVPLDVGRSIRIRDRAIRRGGELLAQVKKGSRAAMVKIGKHFDGHETAIVEFLAGTKLTSPQSIWTAIAAKLGLGPEVADDCSDAIDAVDIVPEPERRSPTVDPSFYLSNSRDASRDEGPSSEQARARASGPRRKAVAPTIEAPRDPKIPGHRASASTLCSSARARTTSGTCGPRSRTG